MAHSGRGARHLHQMNSVTRDEAMVEIPSVADARTLARCTQTRKPLRQIGRQMDASTLIRTQRQRQIRFELFTRQRQRDILHRNPFAILAIQCNHKRMIRFRNQKHLRNARGAVNRITFKLCALRQRLTRVLRHILHFALDRNTNRTRFIWHRKRDHTLLVIVKLDIGKCFIDIDSVASAQFDRHSNIVQQFIGHAYIIQKQRGSQHNRRSLLLQQLLAVHINTALQSIRFALMSKRRQHIKIWIIVALQNDFLRRCWRGRKRNKNLATRIAAFIQMFAHINGALLNETVILVKQLEYVARFGDSRDTANITDFEHATRMIAIAQNIHKIHTALASQLRR
mmetsp:Transcript_39915/g.65437  ORF Transcript_39915/g.65437 Transcript_39915/m.65437 type:complete len:340 (-) Transcript_39915:585-1604(-)